MFNFPQCRTHLPLPNKFYNILEYHENNLISQYPKLESFWVHLKLQTRFSFTTIQELLTATLVFTELQYFKYIWDNLWANWREASMERKQHDILHPHVIIAAWNVTYDPSQRSFLHASMSVMEAKGTELQSCAVFLYLKKTRMTDVCNK